MRITSFWAAFVGAIVIWIVSWLANKLVGDRHSAVAR
jgi:putative membrane protein